MNNFDPSSLFRGKTIKKINKDTNKTTNKINDKIDVKDIKEEVNKTTEKTIEEIKEIKEETSKSHDKIIEDIKERNNELIIKLTNLSIEYIKILRNYKNLLEIRDEEKEEKEILSMFKQYSIDENKLMNIINQKIISTEEIQIDQKITSIEEKQLNKIFDSPEEDKIKLSFNNKEILIDKNSMYILINQIRDKEYYVYQGYANNFYNVIQDHFFENGVEVIETNAQKHNELMLNFNEKGIVKRLGPSLYRIEDLNRFVEKYKKHIK